MRLDHLLSMETGTECHDSVIRVKTRSVHRKLGTDLLLFNFQGPERSLKREKSPWYGGVAQLGEHLPCKQGVMGSNPIISTKRSNLFERVSSTKRDKHGYDGENQHRVTVCSSGG